VPDNLRRTDMGKGGTCKWIEADPEGPRKVRKRNKNSSEVEYPDGLRHKMVILNETGKRWEREKGKG